MILEERRGETIEVFGDWVAVFIIFNTLFLSNLHHKSCIKLERFENEVIGTVRTTC